MSFLRERPLIWPIVFYYIIGFLALVPTFDLTSEVLSSYTLVVLLGLAASIIPVDFKKTLKESSIDTNSKFEVFVLIIICAAVIICLSLVDFDEFRLQRGLIRKDRLLYEIIDLNIIASWVATYLFFNSNNKLHQRKMFILLFFVISLSIYIGFIEGRRAVIALPISFLIISYMIALEKINLKALFTIFLFCALLVFLFVLVTASRTSAIVESSAIMNRLFWPSVALYDFLRLSYSFDPDSLMQFLRLFGSNFGVSQYETKTVSFGPFVGYSEAIGIVKINIGIILEAFLFAGLIGGGLVLFSVNVIFVICFKLCKKAPMNLHILLIMLFFHGYQMEIPYTIMVMLKITFFGLILYIAKILFLRLLVPSRMIT